MYYIVHITYKLFYILLFACHTYASIKYNFPKCVSTLLAMLLDASNTLAQIFLKRTYLNRSPTSSIPFSGLLTTKHRITTTVQFFRGLLYSSKTEIGDGAFDRGQCLTCPRKGLFLMRYPSRDTRWVVRGRITATTTAYHSEYNKIHNVYE